MVNRKTSTKTGPSDKKSSAAARTKAAPARSGQGKSASRGTAARAVAPKAASVPKGSAAHATGQAKIGAKAAGATRTVPKGAGSKGTGSKGVASKGAGPKILAPRKKTPTAAPRPAMKPRAAKPAEAAAAAARALVATRDEAARRKLQTVEQEKAELQEQGNQMRAELDSALAEAERLRERVRELETSPAHRTEAEAGSAGPGSFDPTADLDEDMPAVQDDDLEETAGFFDRMDEIRARRNELDRERNDRELEQSDQPFWMICPKCGDLMEESEGENVKLERCENCGGLYLDRGEVDLILSLCGGPEGYRRLHNILKF